MKRWLVPALLVVSLGINIGFLIHWLRPHLAPGWRSPAAGWHAAPIRRHLGLSSRQARRMDGERRQVMEQIRPLREQLRRKRGELFALLKGKDVREDRLDAVLGEIARLQAAIEKVFVMHSLKVRGEFSPAQRRKYEAWLERGLCPGMMAAEHGPAADRGGPGSDCAEGAGMME
jgi:hypothetical protein